MASNLTVEDLTKLCAEADHKGIDAAFSTGSNLSSSLAKAAIKMFKSNPLSRTGEQRAAETLAVLYLASDAEVAKLRFWPGLVNYQNLNSELLKSVPRNRLELFADLIGASTPQFPVVRDLYESGLIDKPHSNTYVAGLIGCCSWPNKNRNGLASTLLARPDFNSEDVWLLFEFDGVSDSSLAGADMYLTNARETWQTVLVDFSNQGLLSRAKLLDESLRALSRDFIQFRAGWFSRFHQAMQPDKSEKFERLDLYLGLLGSMVPPTVSFALSTILSIQKDNLVSFDQLGPHIHNALTAKSKQTVLNAIKLLSNCAVLEPNSRQAICIQSCSALIAENAEIQAKVIELLGKFAAPDNVQVKECFSGYQSAIVASLRKKLPPFLACSDLNHLDQSQQIISLVDLVPTEKGTLKRIDDLNDLVLKASYVLENPMEYLQYEFVLDGMLRRIGCEQEDFAIRTSALLQRANKLIAANLEQPLTTSLCKLIVVWVTGKESEHKNPRAFLGSEVNQLHHKRMECITKRVLEKENSGLLSLPTGEFGWLDASELQRRLSGTFSGFDPLDRCFALLRVHEPDEAIIELVTAGSDHPALKLARNLLIKKQPSEWEIVKTSSWSSHRGIGVLPMTWISIAEPPPDSKGYAHHIVERPETVIMHGIIMPNWREGFFACGAKWLGASLVYSNVDDKAVRHYLHFLHDVSSKPGPMGSLLLALSISSADNDISVAGVDAFVMLVEQKRADFKSIGLAMQNLFQDELLIKTNRWRKNLEAIAKVSPRHSRFVFGLLSVVLSAPPARMPKDLHHLLELLIETRAANDVTLIPQTIDCLANLKASGKTKKLIDQLVTS